MSEKSRKNPRKIKKALDKTACSGYTNGAVSDKPQQISGCSAVLVARLNGVQEAVSSILATRTINPTISRQKSLDFFVCGLTSFGFDHNFDHNANDFIWSN
jgi:hypothetical protein